MENLGERIMRLRKEINYTQEQLAEKMGVTPQSVSKWEKSVTSPDITALPLLADIFGITVDELLGRNRKNTEQEVNRLTSKELKKLMIKIVVVSKDGDNVKIQVPYQFVRTAVNTGMKIPSVGEKLGNVDFAEVFSSVESGMLGEIVNITSANGDTVKISVE